jgi:hypothetical protein
MCQNRPRTASDRRRRGALAATLFFAASTLAPGLHLAFHDDHHDHEGGGIHVHDHDDVDDDDDDVPAGSPALEHRHPRHGDHEHGEGSLFHFGAALGDGAPATVGLVALSPVAEPSPERPERVFRDARLCRVPDVRGPPRDLST